MSQEILLNNILKCAQDFCKTDSGTECPALDTRDIRALVYGIVTILEPMLCKCSPEDRKDKADANTELLSRAEKLFLRHNVGRLIPKELVTRYVDIRIHYASCCPCCGACLILAPTRQTWCSSSGCNYGIEEEIFHGVNNG